MLRYRVYSKNILCDGMTESEAKEVIKQIKSPQDIAITIDGHRYTLQENDKI